MYIKLVSDLHIGINPLWIPSETKEDKNTVLVIAGDISPKLDRLNSWFIALLDQFKNVIVVLGNHDYWGGNVSLEVDKLRKLLPQELIILENNTIVIENVKFVGATLWTDYHKGDPLVMCRAIFDMNDYKFIRYGADYIKCLPKHLHAIHVKSKDYIFTNAVKDNPEQRVVVVTHMAPSQRSINRYYSDSNYYYFSDLEQHFTDDIDYWMHGHTHSNSDYFVNSTNVIANPMGYGNENLEFNEYHRILV